MVKRGFGVLFLLATALGAREDEKSIVVGWRGDGSGRYPSAEPPSSWGRISKATRALRGQASRPQASDPGSPLPDGVLREWLVLAPAPRGARADKEILPNEAELSPAEGERTAGGEWKKVRLETAWLDFSQILGKAERAIGCAATYVFSEAGGKFRLDVTQLGAFQIVLNGKPLPAGYGRYGVDLAKGWNRLLVKVAVRETEWACTVVLGPRSPAEYENSNVAWMTPLPGVQGGFYGGGMGCGSPIVVGDRIYLLSEPHDLLCLNKADGKILWVRTNSYFDAADAKDKTHPAYAQAESIARRLNEMNDTLRSGPFKNPGEKVQAEHELYAKMAEIDPLRYKRPETPDVGFSGLTPTSDGHSIYLWLGTGVTACYDLEGRRKWIRADILPGVEHGFSSSPLLVDGKVIVFMRDLLAVDAKSGGLAWRVPLVPHEGANPEGYFHGSPVAFRIEGAPLVALPNGTILRAADGKILFTFPEMGKQTISSPVLAGDMLLQASSTSMKFYIHKLPTKLTEPLKLSTEAISIATPGFPHYYLPWYLGSPVVQDGLAYLMNNAGVLTVIDLKEAKILYQRMLNLDHFQTSNEGAARGCGISPTLAGKQLYFFGNSGASVILAPGREFRAIGKNKLENLVSIGHWGERQERFVSNPVFDGKRLYVRGEGHLYAIGP